MACLDVESVNEKICCIQNLEESALEKECALLAKDLKGYIENNFMLDVFQQKMLDRVPADTFKESGARISDAFLNRYPIEAQSGERVKCPKVTIKFCVFCIQA